VWRATRGVRLYSSFLPLSASDAKRPEKNVPRVRRQFMGRCDPRPFKNPFNPTCFDPYYGISTDDEATFLDSDGTMKRSASSYARVDKTCMTCLPSEGTLPVVPTLTPRACSVTLPSSSAHGRRRPRVVRRPTRAARRAPGAQPRLRSGARLGRACVLGPSWSGPRRRGKEGAAPARRRRHSDGAVRPRQRGRPAAAPGAQGAGGVLRWHVRRRGALNLCTLHFLSTQARFERACAAHWSNCRPVEAAGAGAIRASGAASTR